ncbi:PhaM family polyhydroxyalkanoate granule multifunctional regulatory protein, partial [Paracidovorax cattleyae]
MSSNDSHSTSSDTSPFGFGRFVPGFDFLQNLAKGAAAGMPQMPPLSGWVAPTISVEELEKRISELKAVQFWLDQNSRALTATVQALEVQKMTLSTLQGMNVAMGDIAKAFTPQVSPSASGPAAPRPDPFA